MAFAMRSKVSWRWFFFSRNPAQAFCSGWRYLASPPGAFGGAIAELNRSVLLLELETSSRDQEVSQPSLLLGDLRTRRTPACFSQIRNNDIVNSEASAKKVERRGQRISAPKEWRCSGKFLWDFVASAWLRNCSFVTFFG